MKNSIKIFFVGFIVQIACLSLIHAEENLSLQDFPHYQVTEQSQIYPMIEKAYVDLFKSTLNKSLCPTVGDTANLAMSLGLTIEKSSEIASLCHQKNQNLTKYFTRKYTVIFDLEKKIHFDSWTNKSGMTYLVFDKGVSSEKLKLMLLHELAISLDSKFKMFYTGFLMHQNTTKSITMDIDDPIVKVFNYSHRDDFSHAFAIARANNFERYYLNQKLVGENNHEECAEEFKKNLAFIQTTQSSDFVKKTTHDLLGSLLDQMFIII